jgi:hypothetical protein
MRRINKFLIYLLAATIASLLYYYLNYCKPLFCMPCGNIGHSRSLRESIDRGTFVKEYKNFKVFTDSLLQKVIVAKTYFLERKFKYGLTNAEETEIMPDSLGYLYQIGINRSDNVEINWTYMLYMPVDFYSAPDTIKCEIWSYANGLEKPKKVGDAIVY